MTDWFLGFCFIDRKYFLLGEREKKFFCFLFFPPSLLPSLLSFLTHSLTVCSSLVSPPRKILKWIEFFLCREAGSPNDFYLDSKFKLSLGPLEKKFPVSRLKRVPLFQIHVSLSTFTVRHRRRRRRRPSVTVVVRHRRRRPSPSSSSVIVMNVGSEIFFLLF